MKILGKKGFTLTELIVAVAISTTVLVVIFSFVADTVTGLSEQKAKSEMYDSLFVFLDEAYNYKNQYGSGEILIDASSGSGSDVLVFKNYENTQGIMLGVIDKKTMRLANAVSEPYYSEKILGVRVLTPDNLTELSGDPTFAYQYDFYVDKLYSGMYIKTFQAEWYNTGTILDVSGEIFPYFNPGLDGVEWSKTPDVILTPISINF